MSTAFDAYHTSGWTAQNMDYPPDPDTVTPPALPDGVVRVTITGTHLTPDGDPQAGNVWIRSSTTHEVDGVVIGPFDKRIWFDEGTYSVVLPTADPGWAYSVVEAFPGGERYTIVVPADDTDPYVTRSLRVITSF